jgi:hypothetical protein
VPQEKKGKCKDCVTLKYRPYVHQFTALLLNANTLCFGEILLPETLCLIIWHALTDVPQTPAESLEGSCLKIGVTGFSETWLNLYQTILSHN